MKPRLTTIQMTLFLLAAQQAVDAGDINQPTHLPNRSINKINQVRLLTLTGERNGEDKVDEELGRFGIGRLNQSGCNLNVGNTIGEAPGQSGDRDVIINGDVINICK